MESTQISLYLWPSDKTLNLSLRCNIDIKCTFSPVMANGALNHCSKVAQDLKIAGKRKFKRAHNSGSLFCKKRDVLCNSGIAFCNSQVTCNSGTVFCKEKVV